MLKKIMAKFGVGAATVDLRLDKEAYRLGETATGTIRIEGGNVEQRISELSVIFALKAYIKGQEITRNVANIPVLRHFVVQPKPHVQEIPFHFELPHDLAISTPHVQYFLQTRLDVEQALDPTDLDRITVLPPVHIEQVIRALELSDFRQKADSGKLTPLGQEFAFFPGRRLSAPVNELEVIFFDTPDALRLLVELDIAQAGFFRKEKEQRAEIQVPRELLAAEKVEELSRYLVEQIEYILSNPHAVSYFSTTPYLHRGHHHGHHGMGGMMGGMIGGMAAGLIGGMLLNEMMDEAGELLGADDFFGGDGGDGGEGGDDGGFFSGGDFGDFGGGDDF